MNTDTTAPASNNTNAVRDWWQDLRSAGMLWLVLAAVLAVAGYSWFLGTQGVELAAKIDGDSIETLGQLGDSFGALTAFFNALAFMALIAAVVLQTRELRESRTQLELQAKAQIEWAAAARDQIKLTASLESIRIRPFLKAEWQPDPTDPGRMQYIVRNVGLGVGIVTEYELRAADASFGTVQTHTGAGEEVRSKWRQSLNHALLPAEFGNQLEITLRQFDDMNRALAPTELQSIAVVRISGDARHAAYAKLVEMFRPLIKFRSANRDEWTTENQFSDHPGATLTASLPTAIA